MKKIQKLICFVFLLALSITPFSMVKADTQDYSTSESAKEIITEEKLQEAGFSPEASKQLKDKADILIDEYVSQRLTALKAKYKGYEGFPSSTIDQQTTAEMLDQFIKDNFHSWTTGRTKEITEAINAATTIDAVYGITLSANIDARKGNIKIASDIISDIPDSPEKQTVLADIGLVQNWLDKWTSVLFTGGLPEDYKDIPLDYKYTGEGGSAFLKEAFNSMKSENGVNFKDITDNIIGRASTLRKNETKSEGTIEFKSNLLKKLFEDWETTSHPFYLDDTIRHILPELDELALTLEVAEYTVTYTDGTDNESIFPNQVFVVKDGEATPKYDSDITREGYTFKGWTPAISDTVTANTTYTAQWEKVVEQESKDPIEQNTSNSTSNNANQTKPTVPNKSTLPKTGMASNNISLFIGFISLFVGFRIIFSKKQKY